MNEDTRQPIPQGNYLPASRMNDIIYTSGMTPRENGVLMYSGKIKTSLPIKTYVPPVRLATHNALTAARALLQHDEKISAIIQLSVYLNAEEDFTQHSKVADIASTLLVEELGAAGIGSRIAFGVATLPSNAPVEVTLVAVVSK